MFDFVQYDIFQTRSADRSILNGLFCFFLWAGLLAATTAFAGAGSLVEVDGDGVLSLHVNFETPPTPAQLADAEGSWRVTARLLCDATDGQVTLDRITFTGGVAGREAADLRVIPTQCRSTAPMLGIGRLGSFSTICGHSEARPRTLAHELGHLAFGLGDQYAEADRDIDSHNGVVYRCSIGPGFDPGTMDEENHSLMQPSGSTRCLDVDGGGSGVRCKRDSDCDSDAGEMCVGRLLSELSVRDNHDQVKGGAGVCPDAEPTTRLRLQQDAPIRRQGDVTPFDPTSFQSAAASADFALEIEAAGRALLDARLDTEVEVGTLAFNHLVAAGAPLAALDAVHAPVVEGAIDGLEAGGWTAIGEALGAAHDLFAQPQHQGHQQVVVLLSDGENNRGREIDEVLPQLVDAGIQVYPIAAGLAADSEALGAIARRTGGGAYAPASFDDVPAVYRMLRIPQPSAGVWRLEVWAAGPALQKNSDGIVTWKECGTDTDGDGIPNDYEVDADGDDIFDALEADRDENHDGVPDACDSWLPKS